MSEHSKPHSRDLFAAIATGIRSTGDTNIGTANRYKARAALRELAEQFEALHGAAKALLESADDQTHPDDGFPLEEWLDLVDAVRASNPASTSLSDQAFDELEQEREKIERTFGG
jgi:hypothetical protein